MSQVRFWCSTLESPWTWEWRAYPGVWAATAAIATPYLVSMKRRSGANPDARKKVALFLSGTLAFLVASDWPLGLLGASYLASAHMVQYVLYTLVAAPLLMLGTPEWMARRILGRLHLYRTSTRLSRPVIAGLVHNLLLIATHAPWTVDTLRANQFGSFAMDVVWLISGLIVWLPIVSPLPEHRMNSYPGRMVYLFLAMGVVPAVPAGFLTFASFPLYATYELAPRVHGITADADQQMAGLIMKLGGTPIIWGVITVLMMRWHDDTSSRPAPTPPRPPARGTAPA